MIVAYLKSFSASATPLRRPTRPALGDAARGRQILEGKGQLSELSPRWRKRLEDWTGSHFQRAASASAAQDSSALERPSASADTGEIAEHLRRDLLEPDAEICAANRTYRAVHQRWHCDNRSSSESRSTLPFSFSTPKNGSSRLQRSRLCANSGPMKSRHAVLSRQIDGARTIRFAWLTSSR